MLHQFPRVDITYTDENDSRWWRSRRHSQPRWTRCRRGRDQRLRVGEWKLGVSRQQGVYGDLEVQPGAFELFDGFVEAKGDAAEDRWG